MRSLRLLGEYLSLSVLDWTDIPPFAVIAGANGVGKTQLLELLAAELNAVNSYTVRPKVELEPQPTSAGYLPALWRLDDAKVSHELFKPVTELMKVIEGQLSPPVDLGMWIEHIIQSAALKYDPELEPLARRVIEGLSKRGKLRLPVSHSDLLEELDTYDLVSLDARLPLARLAEIFYAYVNARVTSILRGEPAADIDARHGHPPWNEANQLLRFFDTRFQLTSPDDLRFAYELKCYFPEDQVTVKPSGLSSGEQAVLALVALVVATSVLGARKLAAGPPAAVVESSAAVVPAAELESGPQGGIGELYKDDCDNDGDDDEPAAPVQEPRWESQSELLLLDEPDAHLHTSMVKRYLEHLGQLTKRGVQIIMVTHRPDTIALAPEGSLFEMRREGDRTSIVKVESKAELIGRMAADTISVLPGVRVVLVEDEDDSRFHQLAYERVRELGVLLGPPRLVFMPVLAKDPNRPGGGGKHAVIKRLAAFGKEGLGAVFRGLIDGDNETDDLPAGVIRLERYTLESYLVDPIALYFTVVNNPEIDEELRFSEECRVRLGQLDRLRAAGAVELQRIADHVLGRLEQVLSPAPAERTRRTVKLYGGAGEVQLEYPQWIFSASKDTLIAAVGKLHGGIFKHAQFRKGLERSALVPEELIASYRRLATDPS